MSFKATDVKELSSHEHEVLGVDFCSGYTDIFGKWNTGFNCPRIGNGETVYCCGTGTYKYCCTRRDQHSSTGISQSVIIGSALGSVFVVVLFTLVSCIICRKCIPYNRRAHPSLNGGPLYSMHCNSTASGMTNLYAFSGQTTPLDPSSHVLLNLDNTENHIYAQLNNVPRGIGRSINSPEECSTPTDPPPPYNEDNTRRQVEPNSFALQSSSSLRQPCNQNRRLNDTETPQNRHYWQTKF